MIAISGWYLFPSSLKETLEIPPICKDNETNNSTKASPVCSLFWTSKQIFQIPFYRTFPEYSFMQQIVTGLHNKESNNGKQG